MADINDLKILLEKLRDNMPDIMTDVALSITLNGKDLSEYTIRERGFGASYKDEEYKEKRAEKGLQINYVDLAFTNEMWNGMQPAEVVNNGYIYYSALTHNNKDGLYKMEENFNRYGNFIRYALTTGDNPDKLNEVLGFEFNRILNNYIYNE